MSTVLVASAKSTEVRNDVRLLAEQVKSPNSSTTTGVTAAVCIVALA
jgi:hypothetical protein